MAILSESELAAIRSEVGEEFPFDPALQQVHIAGRVIFREAEVLGIDYVEYVNRLAKEAMEFTTPSRLRKPE
jgi:hypothetical protein